MREHMNLFRFGTPEQEKPGVVAGGKRLNICYFGEDYDEAFFANGWDRPLEETVSQAWHQLSGGG
jgi:2,4-didehydro-3-deoxy-L-rhamnonate hydrolase